MEPENSSVVRNWGIGLDYYAPGANQSLPNGTVFRIRCVPRNPGREKVFTSSISHNSRILFLTVSTWVVQSLNVSQISRHAYGNDFERC
jgi:hypothetical protein